MGKVLQFQDKKPGVSGIGECGHLTVEKLEKLFFSDDDITDLRRILDGATPVTFESTTESVNAGFEREAERIRGELGLEAELFFRHPDGKLTGKGFLLLSDDDDD